jgi:transcriptional regulator with XRE-family HTH domain
MKKAKSKEAFGEKLRKERTAAKITLRKFAAQLGVSPTYVSQVEQGNFPPMTAERATKIAEILGGNADDWVALADRIPDDLDDRIRKHPNDMPELMRLATGLTSKEFETIKDVIREIKRKKGKR